MKGQQPLDESNASMRSQEISYLNGIVVTSITKKMWNDSRRKNMIQLLLEGIKGIISYCNAY